MRRTFGSARVPALVLAFPLLFAGQACHEAGGGGPAPGLDSGPPDTGPVAMPDAGGPDGSSDGSTPDAAVDAGLPDAACPPGDELAAGDGGCVPDPCLKNNGGCGDLDAGAGVCYSSGGVATCTCNLGFELDGGTCVDRCTANGPVCPAESTCSHGGQTGVICTCNPGYQKQGNACIDLCTISSECPANSTCSHGSTGIVCTCNPGYVQGTGGTCIDQCVLSNGGCQAHSYCEHPAGGGYPVCVCAATYEPAQIDAGMPGVDAGTICVVDPCSEGNGNCGPNAICASDAGVASCICEPGETLVNGNCVDTCSINNGGCVNGTCTHGAGNIVQCQCPFGDQLTAQSVCVPDPCHSNNGGCGALSAGVCTSSAGIATCTCNTGYALSNGTCIDACQVQNGGCSHATCTHAMPGNSVLCNCNPGYAACGANGCCDECLDDNGGCTANSTCMHAASGALLCPCNADFEIAPADAGAPGVDGGLLCVADPCASGNGGCGYEADGLTPAGACVSSAGIVTNCACAAGYKLTSGPTCSADPCAIGNGGCSPVAQCTSSGPQLHNIGCACGTGFAGDGGTCTGGIVQASAGGENSCAIDTTGTLRCWGVAPVGSGRSSGTVDSPATVTASGVTGWSSVSAGGAWRHASQFNSPSPGFACAIATNGTLWCWGSNASGQLGLGNGSSALASSPLQVGSLSTWASVAAGVSDACAIQTNGTLWCWGGGGTGIEGPGTEGTIVNAPVNVGGSWSSVSVGQVAACGIQADGSLLCWGSNTNGQLGNAMVVQTDTPRQVGVATDWTAVSVGANAVCALESGGTLSCWGGNAYGETGLSASSMPVMTPTLFEPGTTWSAVAVGWTHACAVASNGSLWCWGSDLEGELGVGTTAGIPNGPVQVGSAMNWTSVSAGGSHTCGTQRNPGNAGGGGGSAVSLSCWGDNGEGQIGLGTDGAVVPASPVQAGTGVQWKSVVQTGGQCALQTNGSAFCWGTASSGELGIGGDLTQQAAAAPVPLPFSGTWLGLSNGPGESCGVDMVNSMWCWGLNISGSLGTDPSVGNEASPLPVWATVMDWASVSAGNKFACGVQQNGSLWCWGEIVPSSSVSSLTQMSETNDWGSVTCGGYTACAIKQDGSLWCWGDALYGLLGVGATSIPAAQPQQVGTSHNWASVSIQRFGACGVQTDGTLWCWGEPTGGTEQDTPLRVDTATNWAAVSVGALYVCALKQNGTLWCWGDLTDSIGLPVTGNYSTPTEFGASAISPGQQWTSVSSGTDHVCATRSDGTLWCFGENGQGQLGNGAAFIVSPQRVF
jgi:alpha-tubulin suppressor-like RCC1 family protein